MDDSKKKEKKELNRQADDIFAKTAIAALIKGASPEQVIRALSLTAGRDVIADGAAKMVTAMGSMAAAKNCIPEMKELVEELGSLAARALIIAGWEAPVVGTEQAESGLIKISVEQFESAVGRIHMLLSRAGVETPKSEESTDDTVLSADELEVDDDE